MRTRICWRQASASLFLFALLAVLPVRAQNDVMMQAFYWNVPVDATNKNGTWWDNLASKASAWNTAGIRGIWVPVPSKGNWGIEDMGYGVFDYYDLGNYNQKGSTETRFGSRAELTSMINAMHGQNIEVYSDIVLNHIYNTDEALSEANPAVKQYVFDNAIRGGIQYRPFPNNEIRWRIPNAQTGDYFIKIKGYHLGNCAAPYTDRAYQIMINWTGAAETDQPVYWEFEPNNGNGQSNNFPSSGKTLRAHMNSCSDVDEYKVTLTATGNLDIKLDAMKGENSNWGWGDDYQYGYYPVEIWRNGVNLAPTTLTARTMTAISFVNHTGAGEANFTWNYTHFHPVDNSDFLTAGDGDGIIPNTKWFGHDFNTYFSVVQQRQKDWGTWLTNTVGFDGYRLDFVRGFQTPYTADWVKAMPKKSGNVQRFTVAEYWTGDGNILKNWVAENAGYGADIDVFDFPLKFELNNMANWTNNSYNMANLNSVGLIRGYGMSGTQVVTFVENHDTGKEDDKWVNRDWKMPYAYILFAEGRPCLFYPHYYSVVQNSNHTPGVTTQAPASLQDDLKKQMFARRTYLGGSMTVLSQNGNPWPAADVNRVFVARRQGAAGKTGAILVLNNHDTNTMGLWVNNTPNATQYSNWAGKTLVNAFNPSQTTVVQADGRVYVSAPARGYTIWVPQTELVTYSGSRVMGGEAMAQEVMATEAPQTFALEAAYPNPFNPSTTLGFTLPQSGQVRVEVFNMLGQQVATLADQPMTAGQHQLTFDAADLAGGQYLYTVTFEGQRLTGRITLLK